MKTLRIVGIIFLVLGILLYLVGILFKFMHWPDLWKGLISGPIIGGIGIVLFIISLKRIKSDMNE